MEFAISPPKMFGLLRNQKQTYQLNSRAQMWPSGLTLAMTLNFQGQICNLLYLSQKWSNCHETKSKHAVFKISARPRTLTGKIWVGPASFPSLSYINFDKIVLRSGKFQILFWRLNMSIELQVLKCDHQVWPWSWPWPWSFKVKYGISYISAKSGPIATKQKANISIESQALCVWPWP